MEATQRLIRGRTAFIIAHRPSTLENCDILLTIERGRVATTLRQTCQLC
jgi:ABC-type multidrug transport system fused ATPase/permease subunit